RRQRLGTVRQCHFAEKADGDGVEMRGFAEMVSDRIAAAGLLQSPDQVRQRNIRLEVDDELRRFFDRASLSNVGPQSVNRTTFETIARHDRFTALGDAANRQCDALQSRALKARSKDIGPGYVRTAIGRGERHDRNARIVKNMGPATVRAELR